MKVSDIADVVDVDGDGDRWWRICKSVGYLRKVTCMSCDDDSTTPIGLLYYAYHHYRLSIEFHAQSPPGIHSHIGQTNLLLRAYYIHHSYSYLPPKAIYWERMCLFNLKPLQQINHEITSSLLYG